jgi:hypothetical protein
MSNYLLFRLWKYCYHSTVTITLFILVHWLYFFLLFLSFSSFSFFSPYVFPMLVLPLRLFLLFFLSLQSIFCLMGEGGERTGNRKKHKNKISNQLYSVPFQISTTFLLKLSVYCSELLLPLLPVSRSLGDVSPPTPPLKLPSSFESPSTCISTLSQPHLLQLYHRDVDENSHGYPPPGPVSNASFLSC